jgi:hypothetical protein
MSAIMTLPTPQAVSARLFRPLKIIVIVALLLSLHPGGINASKAAGPSPVFINEIPQRFRGVWVLDRAHCTHSFPNRHVVIGAKSLEEGPELVTRRMIKSDVSRISVISGRPDDVALVLAHHNTDKGKAVMLKLEAADRQMHWSSPNGDARDLFRC